MVIEFWSVLRCTGCAYSVGGSVPGRKRVLAVDALGLIIAVVLTAASVTTTVIGARLLDKVVELPDRHPGVDRRRVQARPGHPRRPAPCRRRGGQAIRHPARVRADRERWVVEQVNGTPMLHRRIVREYESRPESSVSRTLWASAANLMRRLTGTSTGCVAHVRRDRQSMLTSGSIRR
jgi:hypothetical protein